MTEELPLDYQIPVWLLEQARDVYSGTGDLGPVEWCELYVKLVGSSLSERFDCSLTPWLRKPLDIAGRGEARKVTFVKPVQSGGSALGECLICFWIATESSFNMQYNWENDLKAGNRWLERVEKILKANEPVMRLAPSLNKQDGKWSKGSVIFDHCNFDMQGVFEPSNLDSDTIRFQINEEVHNWEAGRLEKAYNRSTAVWNAVHVNISNASKKDTELHQAFLSGTQEHWQVRCSGCGHWHAMRTHWDKRNPHLGGLRYDADGCRYGDGGYNYNRLQHTIRYEFPCCRFVLRDEPRLRRELSESGDYSEPQNAGAPLTERSYTYEAVSVHNISWLNLIMQKHAAMKALRYGDPSKWYVYLAERENKFYDPDEDRPVVGHVTLSDDRKIRPRLATRVVTFGAFDRQRGKARMGEVTHWWGVLRDVALNGDSRLVWEGKLETVQQIWDECFKHGAKPWHVVADSGDHATEVYQMCIKYGFNAIKGGKHDVYAHDDGSKLIYSPEEFLYKMVTGAGPTRDNVEEEPLYWLYSKHGIREKLHWIRGSKLWEVPSDVSEDYKTHMEAEEDYEKIIPSTGERSRAWRQVKTRNDLFVCECYIAMLMEMGGFVAPPEDEKLE